MEQNENMTSVVIEQEGENKKRRALALILTLAVIAFLGIGTTFAYLTYTGNQTPNRFTTDAGISCDLLEPAWTKAVTDEGYWPAVASDGVTSIPAAANNTKSGSVVDKDPFVVNTSKVGNGDGGSGVDEYVGIRLTFQKWVADSYEGADSEHKENGQYVTMTDTEVAALMKVYAFGNGTETKAGLGALGAGWKQVSNLGEDNQQIDVSAAGDGSDMKDTVKGTSKDGSMYFVYTTQIKPLGYMVDGTDDNPEVTPNQETEASSGKYVSTTNLFTKVKHVADKSSTEYTNFLSYLYKGNAEKGFLNNRTTDPGWRVLVSAAAVDATGLTSLDEDHAKAINDAQVTITDDGSSAIVSGRSSGTGTGWRANASIPEDEWQY